MPILDLGAEISLAEGFTEHAIEFINEVIATGWAPCSYLNIYQREVLVDAYIAASKHEKVEHKLKEILKLYGGHLISLYELGGVCEMQGKLVDAASEYGIFLEARQGADDGLVPLLDAREKLTRLTR